MTDHDGQRALEPFPSDDEIRMAALIVAGLRKRLHRTPGMVDVYVEGGDVVHVTVHGTRFLPVRLFNSIYDATNGN